jgi:hypothetical protein
MYDFLACRGHYARFSVGPRGPTMHNIFTPLRGHYALVCMSVCVWVCVCVCVCDVV